jgi:RNA polymerase-binding transcription factor DksA
MAIDYKHFKKKLEAEKVTLEKELGKVGRRNPDNLSDWEATPDVKDVSQADENIVADNIESYDENTAIVNTLETRYNDVKLALDKIEKGTYGICEISEHEIEIDRLEANPSARTCKEHME